MNVSPWSRYVLLALVLIVAAGMAGCESTAVTGGPTPAKCQLAAVGPVSIAADGGSATISVSAPQECGWDVSTQATWLTEVLPLSGQGNGTVAFRAAPNPDPAVRQSEIIINEERVRISQQAAPCRFTITPTDLTIVATGGTGLINISTLTGCSWTAASDEPWITLTSTVTGSGNGSISFSVASNTGMSRSGSVTIAGRSATITQSGTQPTPGPGPGPGPGPAPSPPCGGYLITPTSQTIGAGGGAGPLVSVAAASGCTWTAVSNRQWITVLSGAIGNGNGSVTFTVAANPGNARNGTLTIAGQTFTVTQGTDCTYQLNGLMVNAPPTGGTLEVIVTASAPLCSWTASTTASWITITSGASITGSGRAQFVIPANTKGFRSATIDIAGYTVTVNQP